MLAILNIFESYDGCELTEDAEGMYTLGVKDAASLESYLEAKFNFRGFNEEALKELFASLLLRFPGDDILSPPVDAEIDYDDESNVCIGLSIYIDVFDYRQANLTFRKFFAKLPQMRTLRQVINVLQSISDKAFRISEHLTAGSEFKVALCRGN